MRIGLPWAQVENGRACSYRLDEFRMGRIPVNMHRLADGVAVYTDVWDGNSVVPIDFFKGSFDNQRIGKGTVGNVVTRASAEGRCCF